MPSEIDHARGMAAYSRIVGADGDADLYDEYAAILAAREAGGSSDDLAAFRAQWRGIRDYFAVTSQSVNVSAPAVTAGARAEIPATDGAQS